MAIQLDLLTSEFGVPFGGAYFRIVTASVNRQRSNVDYKYTVMLDVVGYATMPENDETKEIAFHRFYAPFEAVEAYAGTNFLERCYKWLMDQPDMFGSIAV